MPYFWLGGGGRGGHKRGRTLQRRARFQDGPRSLPRSAKERILRKTSPVSLPPPLAGTCATRGDCDRRSPGAHAKAASSARRVGHPAMHGRWLGCLCTRGTLASWAARLAAEPLRKYTASCVTPTPWHGRASNCDESSGEMPSWTARVVARK